MRAGARIRRGNLATSAAKTTAAGYRKHVSVPVQFKLPFSGDIAVIGSCIG
jgi:hypothetical protein